MAWPVAGQHRAQRRARIILTHLKAKDATTAGFRLHPGASRLRHIVIAMKCVSSPLGPVLDRFVGPGWTASPAQMLDMLRSGGHVFQLDGSDLQLKAIRQQDDSWGIAVVGADNRPVRASTLPHWQMDQAQPTKGPRPNWLQRLLDPDSR